MLTMCLTLLLSLVIFCSVCTCGFWPRWDNNDGPSCLACYGVWEAKQAHWLISRTSKEKGEVTFEMLWASGLTLLSNLLLRKNGEDKFHYLYFINGEGGVCTRPREVSLCVCECFLTSSSLCSARPFSVYLCVRVWRWKLWSESRDVIGKGNLPSNIHSVDGETVETVADFILGAPKSLQMVTAAMKLKDAYSLEGKLWPT